MVGAMVLPFSPPSSPVYIYRGKGDLGCSSLVILYRVDRRNMGEGPHNAQTHYHHGTELKWLVRWYLHTGQSTGRQGRSN